jgi:hypothetical protein
MSLTYSFSILKGELYERCVVPAMASNPFIYYADGFDQYATGNRQFHDAGWDAYCTGALFTHELKQSELSDPIEAMKAMTSNAGNKLFMMQSLYHMDIDPKRPNGWLKFSGLLLHLSKFDSEVKNDGILKVFTNAGYVLTTLEVLWIDGTSTFVSIDTTDSEVRVGVRVRISVAM